MLCRNAAYTAGTMLVWEKAGYICIHEIALCPNVRLRQLARLPVPAPPINDTHPGFHKAAWAPDSSMVLLNLPAGDLADEILLSVPSRQYNHHSH